MPVCRPSGPAPAEVVERERARVRELAGQVATLEARTALLADADGGAGTP